ncbi:phosphotransferase family protein [Streptomyces sp. NPDC059373]
MEKRLPGGFVSAVTRVGATVRRTPGERAAYVRELLEHLAASGWQGAPRHLGTDERGREVLSYVDGQVPWGPVRPPPVIDDVATAEVARLTRQFHDLTAGTALAEGGEVVCHNDLAPRNTVYRDSGEGLRPVAFIDWDLAAPGLRVHDVAHVCWQFCGTGSAAAEVGARMRVVSEAYGLGDADRRRLVGTVLWWQDRCWRGIDRLADAGDPAMRRLREGGAVAEVRAAYDWTAAHRTELERQLGNEPPTVTR